jgi:cytochrome c
MNLRCLYILVIGLLFIGARLASAELTSEAKIPNTKTTAVFTVQKEKLGPEQLAQYSGCFQCHSVDKAVVGPAYKDVAARYSGKTGARAALIETVKKGGKGNWSDISKGVPMPPHGGRLSAEEIARLVDWVLSLNVQ